MNDRPVPIVVCDKQIDFPKGKENLIERLKSHCPQEAKGIDSYFTDMVAMTEGVRNIGRLNKPLQAMKGAGNILKWMRATGADLINAHISDPVLRGVLAGQSGDHGLPPSKVSAFMHAGITEHYLDGGFYPLGGAFTIPRAFVRALKKAGGEIRLKARVKRILIEANPSSPKGEIIGVEMESGEEIRSSVGVVASGSDARWQIELAPLDARLQRRLVATRVDGSGDRARCFTMTEPDGDASVMTLGVPDRASLPESLARASLQAWCAGEAER